MYENTLAFFSELAGNGVTDVVVSPGSRSTPLAISARFTSGLTVHVNMDERAAGFFALGLAKASKRPVVLVCTSGSAAANYLPAVVEAHLSGVPLIVLTADRPPELRGWGAGQTIDQVGLYGMHVRSYSELPCGRDASEAFFRRAGARCVLDANGAWPGPVHRNWPFREPLEPAGPLPAVGPSEVAVAPAIAAPQPGVMSALAAKCAAVDRGAIVVGPSDYGNSFLTELCGIAERLGWPILADPAAQARGLGRPCVVAHGDALLRSESFLAAHEPSLVLRVGGSPTSKAIRLWMESATPQTVVLTEPGRWEEASFTASEVIQASAALAVAELRDALGDGSATSEWQAEWLAADQAAEAVLSAELDDALTELSIARSFSAIEQGCSYVSSSMPIRDVDSAMGVAATSQRVLVNRGANGIDGLIASAAGATVDCGRVHLLIGDVAFLHDIGSALEAGRSQRPLTMVVVDNDGGGIFSMLPIAAQGDKVAFTELFTTPHEAGIESVRHFPGIEYVQPTSVAALHEALTSPRLGVCVIHLRVDRKESLDQRARVFASVASAISS